MRGLLLPWRWACMSTNMSYVYLYSRTSLWTWPIFFFSKCFLMNERDFRSYQPKLQFTPWLGPEVGKRMMFWFKSSMNRWGKVLRTLEMLPQSPSVEVHLCKCMPAPAMWYSDSGACRASWSHLRILPAMCFCSCLEEGWAFLCVLLGQR